MESRTESDTGWERGRARHMLKRRHKWARIQRTEKRGKRMTTRNKWETARSYLCKNAAPHSKTPDFATHRQGWYQDPLRQFILKTSRSHTPKLERLKMWENMWSSRRSTTARLTDVSGLPLMFRLILCARTWMVGAQLANGPRIYVLAWLCLEWNQRSLIGYNCPVSFHHNLVACHYIRAKKFTTKDINQDSRNPEIACRSH